MERHTMLAVLCAFLLAGPAHAADVRDAHESGDFWDLFREIPRQDALRRYRELVWGEGKPADDREVSRARAAIAKVKANVPRIRRLVTPGKSVFDYPGLLAHGPVEYDEYGKCYSMYVGVYLLRHEGRGPFDFRVRFDAKGVVTRVEDVVWKR